MALLGILSKCERLRDLERFAQHHHAVLLDALGIEVMRCPSDSAFRYCFVQVDADDVCAAIPDRIISLIPGGMTNLDQFICDGKPLRGSIEPISVRGSAFITQVTLFSAAFGVAIAQACYVTDANHKPGVHHRLLDELDLEGVLIRTDALQTH